MDRCPKPAGFHSITPFLVMSDIPSSLSFMEKAFEAEVQECIKNEEGGIMHAQVRIGDSMIMLGPARPEYPAKPCALYLYVADTDASYQAALAAGATSIMEPEDMFYGDRNAGVRDSAGNNWWIATHKKTVPHEELERLSKQQHKST